jgi:hypothetical protein
VTEREGRKVVMARTSCRLGLALLYIFLLASDKHTIRRGRRASVGRDS